jgi:hypothetical protein
MVLLSAMIWLECPLCTSYQSGLWYNSADGNALFGEMVPPVTRPQYALTC